MAPSRRSLLALTPDRLAPDAPLPMEEDDDDDDDWSDEASEEGLVVTSLRLGTPEAGDLPTDEREHWGYVSRIEVVEHSQAQDSFEAEDRDDAWDMEDLNSEEVRQDPLFLGPEATLPGRPTPQGTPAPAGLSFTAWALMGSWGLVLVAGGVVALLIAGVIGAWVLNEPEAPAAAVQIAGPAPRIVAPPPEAAAPPDMGPPQIEGMEAETELAATAEPALPLASTEAPAESPTPAPVAAPVAPSPQARKPIPAGMEDLPEAGPPPQAPAPRRGLFGKKRR